MPILTFGQQVPELVNTFTASPTNLTSSQQSRWQIIDGFETTDTLYAFSAIDFSQIGQDGRFKMNLPGGCQNVGFKTARAESHANGDFNFIAYVEERDTCLCNCNFGDFAYVKKDGISVGLIRVDNKAYEIKDLKEGKLCLRTINIKGSKCISGEGGGELTQHGPEDNIESRNQCCAVRIMILHDAQANILGDIAARARMDILLTNEALQNSIVSACNLRFEMGGVHEYNVQTPSLLNARNEIGIVRDDNQTLRNQENADIVVFYTGLDYFTQDQDILGIALGLQFPGGTVDPIEDAYALVETAPEAIASFTFAHEVGHLFQCRHEETDDSNGTFQHGHSFSYGCFLGFGCRTVLTIMRTLPTADEPRILHYSNPKVKYRRKPTGITNLRDNARQLFSTGCTVAAFRQGDVLMTNISGPSQVCLNSSVQLSAEIVGDAPAPFTYVWETATSISGPYQVVSTDPTITLYGSGVVGQIIYIRLTVSSSDNQVAEEFSILECVAPEGISCEQFLIEDNSGNMTAALPGLHWSVFPNPASSNLELAFLLETPCNFLKIDLLDQNGRILDSSLFRAMETGRHRAHFELGKYPPGIYSIRMTNSNGTTGKTIVKH